MVGTVPVALDKIVSRWVSISQGRLAGQRDALERDAHWNVAAPSSTSVTVSIPR